MTQAPPAWRPRRDRLMIPMRRVWERTGQLRGGDQPLKGGSPEAVAKAEAEVRAEPLNRGALKRLYIAQLLAGDLERARLSAERWSEKDPLDPEALTARADVAAQLGQRDLAIRLLGSVVDLRPDDHKAQWRLARLHRWQGKPERGCRYSSAVAQLHPSDAKLVGLALGCARNTTQSQLFDDLFAMAPKTLRTRLERELDKPTDDSKLSGDFRVEASWSGEQDLDLVIVHPDGYRVSWLGAPTRAVISARDVLSTRSEGLALRGAKPGEYAIELVRDASATGTVSGTVTVRIGKQVEKLPFSMTGNRLRLATVALKSVSRLVPVTGVAPRVRRPSRISGPGF